MTALEPTIAVPVDVITEVCLRAYLAFDGDTVTIEHDLGDGTTIVGYAYSLGHVVTVDYEIVNTR